MSTIAEIEDALMETIRALGVFRSVHSAGRKALPSLKDHPAAYVFFVSERDTGTKPRPVVELRYDVVVVVKNLGAEKSAAADAYSLTDAVRDAVQGKTLGFADIEPFACESRELVDYASGVIQYALRLKTRQYLPVPAE